MKNIPHLLSLAEHALPYAYVAAAICAVASLLIVLLLRAYDLKALLRQHFVLLEITPPATAYKTPEAVQRLFSVLHGMGARHTIKDRMLRRSLVFSLEVVSARETGIRYVIRVPEHDAAGLQRVIVSYLPEVRIRTVEDHLPTGSNSGAARVISFRQKGHYAFPLKLHESFDQHDPIAYLTGAMTELEPGEQIVFQFVVSPVSLKEASVISSQVLSNEDLITQLRRHRNTLVARKALGIFGSLLSEVMGFITDMFHSNSQYGSSAAAEREMYERQQVAMRLKPARSISRFEQELAESIHAKVNQPLYRTELRALVVVNDARRAKKRAVALNAPLASFDTNYQSLRAQSNIPAWLKGRYRLFMFRHRLPSFFKGGSNIFAASEIAALYHFPNSQTSKTENLVRSFSKTLSAPLAIKQHADNNDFDVVLGRNYHHGNSTDIGLTNVERERHVYIVGGTGNGKTTLLEYGIVQDIRSGKGVAIVDPHGDSARRLLRYIPKERMKDVIYFNPRDYDYPIGLNLLELPEGLTGSALAHEKDLVTEAVISVLSKIFDDGMDANAYRIERVLRNVIHTAFTIENATLFTVLRLLTEASYRKKMTRNLKDESLLRFWKEELGKAGEMQRVKISGGPVTRIERFERSESAKRVLGQAKSTINFEDVMNGNKILICNFSKGGLGEDTSTLFGTTVLAKLQLAAWRREDIPEDQRVPFYLYVDEFQNFATDSFMSLFSEARKYKLLVTIAQQSVSQLKEQAMLNTILDNVGTVIAFRSKSQTTEKILLHQFSPHVSEGEIPNLPSYNFYIKIAAVEPLEPSSGMTLLLDDSASEEIAQSVIDSSRSRYATPYTEDADAPKHPRQQKDQNPGDESSDESMPQIDRPSS
jgi:hypothetical protein